jgi:hypothetical protein
VGSKAVRFSHGDFGLVVQALYDAAGKQLLGAEIVEDQFPVLAKRSSDLLHNEPVLLPPEEPELFAEILNEHRYQHGYSLSELSELACVHEHQFKQMYMRDNKRLKLPG